MTPTRQGSFRLFRLFGIDVFLHWSWFLILIYAMQFRIREYSSPVWNALECLALFAIVLLHEFGHALACRQVGGKADQIVLWPLGGVAYVAPPQRPGATLWSIAAGPLVNVILFPLLTGLFTFAISANWMESVPNLYFFVRAICYVNIALLIFNLLPIYPLDGGQILRSLLWFLFGRARSLMIAASVGFIGVAALAALAFLAESYWIGILTVFILLNCWGGLMQARALLRISRAPRRAGFACPGCGAAPPAGAIWGCGKCRNAFDTFETHGTCPHCGTQYGTAFCVECGRMSPLSEWVLPPPW